MEYPIYIKRNKYQRIMIINESNYITVENYIDIFAIEYNENHFGVERYTKKLKKKAIEISQSEFLRFYHDTLIEINNRAFGVNDETAR